MVSWMWVAAAVAGPPQVPEATWVDPGRPPALCLSSVPDGKRIRGKDRQAFVDALAAVSAQVSDVDALGAWRASQAPVWAGVKDHPAWTALQATVAFVLGEPSDALGEIADAHPQDACLGMTAAAAALAGGDVQRARTLVGRAWIAGPSPDLAWLLAVMLEAEGDTDRRASIVDKGLKLDPDHAPLRRLRAELALLRGETDGVEEDLSWLRRAGDTSLDARLMDVRFGQGRIDDYLRLAAAQGAPMGPVPDLSEDEAPLATLRAALGLTAPTQTLRATLVTSEGEIRCDLLVDETPVTVAHFVGLAQGSQDWTDPRTGQPGEGPLYADVPFHRVIPEFMIQTGDPLGTGSGSPGYRFHDEIATGRRFDRPGLLAMANAGPDTNGSQFFVTEVAAEHLSGKHTIFGTCVDVEVVQRIARVPRDSRDKPVSPVVLQRVDIEVLGAGSTPQAPPTSVP